jgi:hypothetical protein
MVGSVNLLKTLNLQGLIPELQSSLCFAEGHTMIKNVGTEIWFHEFSALALGKDKE